MNPSDIIRGFGRPVAYYPALAEHLGGVSATVLLPDDLLDGQAHL